MCLLNSRPTLLVVLGYGCHLTEGLKGMLDRVLEFDLTRGMNVEAIFATGGFTNQRSAPGISEAQLMRDYLHRNRALHPVYIDESAITTEDNIRALKNFIEHGYVGGIKSIQDLNVMVFCDRLHHKKTSKMMSRIFGKDSRFVIIGFKIIEPTLKNIITQSVALHLDILAMDYDFFRRRQLARKSRIIAKS